VLTSSTTLPPSPHSTPPRRQGGLGRPEPALAEWDYGEYEGLRSEDIVKKAAGVEHFS
jgi:broad specificity phosphatase PhoE